MVKLWLLSVISAVLLMQLVVPSAADQITEAVNGGIREQLKAFEQMLALDDGTHKEDLTKLIKLVESALINDNLEQKQAIMNTLQQQFSAEFNQFVGQKLQELSINDGIHGFIQFYQSLLASQPNFKTELEATVAKLQAMLEITNFQEKQEKLMSLDKSFSPEFMQFLSASAQPNINAELQKSVDFLDSLLHESEVKFESEIKALLAQAKSGLGDISTDEKHKTLQEVTNPQSRELSEYLQRKFLENVG